MPTTAEPDRSSSTPPSRGRGDGKKGPYPSTAVRYGAMNWVGEFTCKPDLLDRGGVHVVVQTDRGIELGRQLERCCGRGPVSASWEQVRRYVENSGPEFCRFRAGRVLRQATPQDVDEHRRLNAHDKEDIEQCAGLAAEFNLDMKVISAEHLLGGERIVFYFRAQGRIDFRELVKELAQRYRTRIEMRQVGARDEARLVADWEVCGRECCCKNFLKSLRPVNMKMAKLQKSTLDPSKVSGRCGRLRCCLRYEHQGYQELIGKLPRKGSRVATTTGEGTVVDYQILTQLVRVRTDTEQELAVPLEEITAFDLPKPLPPEVAAEEPARPEAVKPEGERPARPRSRRPRRSRGAEGRDAAQPATPVPEEPAVAPPAPEAPSRPAPPTEAATPTGPPPSTEPDQAAPAPARAAAGEGETAAKEPTGAARPDPVPKRGRRRRRRRPKPNRPPTDR